MKVSAGWSGRVLFSGDARFRGICSVCDGQKSWKARSKVESCWLGQKCDVMVMV